MKENKLIIAAAGAGKTTYIVEESFNRKEHVLITTFTEENEAEIHDKFIKLHGYVPAHVTIQTWFSFLLQHGVRPYQGSCNSILFEKQVNGILLVNLQSGLKYKFWQGSKEVPVYYSEETEFEPHYFTSDMRLYTDKLAKFVIRANAKSNGNVIDRISRIYPTIYIDEVQDLAGYDLEIVKELFHSSSNVICVGDLRQVTYYTHSERKNKPYKHGMIKQYVQDECFTSDHIIVDETTLAKSHRNNKQICDFSSLIYPCYPQVLPCDCETCHPTDIEHQGIYVVKCSDIERYLELYTPVQLRHNVKVKTDPRYICYNFGKSKGKTFDRVVIYPTADIINWLIDSNSCLADKTRAALYVAVTRARYSVAFVIPDKDVDKIHGVEVWSENSLF